LDRKYINRNIVHLLIGFVYLLFSELTVILQAIDSELEKDNFKYNAINQHV
jgi:hypothetical protein